jgi:hypothetical protein
LHRSELENNEDNDGDMVAEPTVEAHVNLAKTPSKCFNYYINRHLNTLAVSRIYPDALAADIDQPDLNLLIQKFLYTQTNSASLPIQALDSSNLPPFHDKITTYPSAVATFFSPSDISGVGGMRNERICAVKSWRKGPARHDCIFIKTDPDAPGMAGLDIAHVRLFFSCTFNGVKYPCALVDWFSHVGQSADSGTGMWVVEPDVTDDGAPLTSVIHLDTIIWAAHLLPVFKNEPELVSRAFSFSDTLDKFQKFYVNKYIDHHAFEIAF